MNKCAIVILNEVKDLPYSEIKDPSLTLRMTYAMALGAKVETRGLI